MASPSAHLSSLRRHNLPLDRKRWVLGGILSRGGKLPPTNTCVHYLHRSAGSTVIKRIKSILGTNKNLRTKTCIWVLNKRRECKKNNIFRSGILKPEYVRNNEENISTVKNSHTISRKQITDWKRKQKGTTEISETLVSRLPGK